MVVVMKKMLVVALEPKVGYRVACQIRSYFFTIRGFKKTGELDAVRTGKIMLCGYLSAWLQRVLLAIMPNLTR